MRTSVSGKAGNRQTTASTGTLDPDEQTGIQRILLAVLKDQTPTHWDQRLKDDPALESKLADALADTLREFASAGFNLDAKPETATDHPPQPDPVPEEDSGNSTHSAPGNGGDPSLETAPEPGNAKATKEKQGTRQGKPASKKSSQKGRETSQGVGMRCGVSPSEKPLQPNTTFSANDPGVSHPIELEFTPPGRATKPEWHCEKLGWFYNLLAQPASKGKRAPLPCMKCAGCIRYEIFLKSLQYENGTPAPIQTVMEFKARTPKGARKFTGNRQHARRLPVARRASFLDQKGVRDDEDGTRKACEGVLIWDGAIPEQRRIQMENHARKQKMTHVKVYVMAVDETKLLQLMPTRLRLPGQNINTCHISHGWAKKRIPYSDWRDGRCRVVGVAEGGVPVTKFWQPERGQRIARSWKIEFAFEWDDDLTPEERELERRLAMPYLHRARYVNFLDWLFCMPSKARKMTAICIRAILKGEEPPLKGWQTETMAPRQMIEETAKFLMGEREPEPALTLAAQRLGFISTLEPHIDPEFLAELTDTLPPLRNTEGPPAPASAWRTSSGPSNVYEWMAA